MGIHNFLKKALKQDVIYWGNPSPDGEGQMTFDSPVDLKGRWEEKIQVVKDEKGREVTSKAQVFLKHDVVAGGFLKLGVTDSSTQSTPYGETGAYEIITKQKNYGLGSTKDFLTVAFL